MIHTRLQCRALAICFALLLCAIIPGLSADWPTFQKDGQRSAVTDEKLAFPLSVTWVYQPTQTPRPSWPEPGRELHRVDFDYAFQPVAAGGLVYFASSADDTLRALDAATGQLKWQFTAGGPIRLAPHIWDGKCYLAADDGYAYCLDAATGAIAWTFRAAPWDRQFVGNDRLISRWPCRSGVLVADGTAYVTAGMWPTDGVFIYALDAKTGKQIWRNDTSGSMYMMYPHGGAWAIGGVAPQGYLAVTKDVLLVPTGRSVPAAFDRRTGKFLHYRSGEYGSFGGYWMTVSGDAYYSPTNAGGADVSVSIGEAAPRPGDGLRGYTAATGDKGDVIANKYRMVISGGIQYAVGNGTLDALVDGKPKWSTPHKQRAYAIVLAGDSVITGTSGAVLAFNAATGKEIWRGEVNGQARGLAVAEGRLIVATQTGAIYAFTSGEDTYPQANIELQWAFDTQSGETDIVRLLAESKVTKGYALIVGASDAHLAERLAAQTDLHFVQYLADDATVAAARARLLANGLYGTRIEVRRLDDATRLPYADFFANAVIVTGPLGKLQPRELYRVLRPCGGVLYAVGASQADAEKLIAHSGAPREEIRPWNNTAIVVRGKLPGAFDWNSTVTSDQRVKWPLELLWFGGPGPDRMIGRHWGTPTPVVANGRYFVIGERHLIAVDAYNGTELWSKEMPDLFWEVANVSADDDSVYANFGTLCLELDAQTGKEKRYYGQFRESKRVSLDTPQSFTITAPGNRTGVVTLTKTAAGLEVLLAIKRADKIGRDNWNLSFDFRPAAQRYGLLGPGVFQVTVVPPATATAAPIWQPLTGTPPTPVLTGKRTTDGSEVLLKYSWEELRKFSGGSPSAFAFTAAMKYIGAGSKITSTPLTDADSSALNNGWTTFVLDPKEEAVSPHAKILIAGDMKALPAQATKYGRFPALTTPGERIHPVTGESVERIYKRGHGCGTLISSAVMDFFRSGTLGYYDVEDDSGTRNFAAVRPGCGLTMIPAQGLLIASEGGAACSCSYNFHTSLALAPAETRRNEDWAVFFDNAPSVGTDRLAVNFGAPGDRRDDNRQLWLGVPRPPTGMPLPCKLEFAEGFGPYHKNADLTPVADTEKPWVYTTGLRGLRRAVFSLDNLQGAVSLAGAKAPAIDARLTEAIWKNGIALPVTNENASVKLRHDDENLYISYNRLAAVDRLGGASTWKKTTSGKDAPVWQDDSCEVFLGDVTGSKTVHLGMSASGAKYDALGAYPPTGPLFDMPRLNGIAIDGDSADWGEEGFRVLSMPGADGKMRPAENLDPTLRFAWDERGLLLLVKVRDDVVTEYQSISALCEKDSLEIFMATAPGSPDRFQLSVGPGADPRHPKARLFFFDHRKTKYHGNLTAEAAGRKTEDGYQVELLLPWKNLNIAPGIGNEVAFQILVNDSDIPGPRYGADWFRSFWHPLGHAGFNTRAMHRLRMSTRTSPPDNRPRGTQTDAGGFYRAEPGYSYPVLDIPKLDGIMVDGNPADWGDRGFKQLTMASVDGFLRAPENFDPSFRLGWNERGVLLLAQVRDQAIVEFPEVGELWRRDSFEFFMAPKRGSQEGFQVIFSTGADPKNPTLRWKFYDTRKQLKGEPLSLEAVGTKTAGGYLIEALIPWKNLAITPAEGGEIGLQICANDCDAETENPSPGFRTIWHPDGHAGQNPMAYQRIRLTTEPSATLQFTRSARADEDGIHAAERPFPWPLPNVPDVKVGEDSTWDGVWIGAVRADGKAFTAEMAIPWKTLESAGLRRDKLIIDFSRRGRMQTRPGNSFLPLALHTSTGQSRPYTVRLHFAEVEGAAIGQRVFDVKLQGKTVLKNFDIAKEAGTSMALVKEFTRVMAAADLTLELVPKSPALNALTAPIISGIEVIAE